MIGTRSKIDGGYRPALTKQIEEDGDPDERQSTSTLDMNADDPKRARDENEDNVGNHCSANQGKLEAYHNKVDSLEETLGEVKGDERRIGRVKGVGDIDGISRQTRHDKDNRHALRNVIGLEPADDQRQVTPQPPAQDERYGKLQEGLPRWKLGRPISIDGDDADV